MDASDELRAALNRSRDESDRDARAKDLAAQNKAKYEREAQEVRARLYEAVELTTKALADEPLVKIEVAPKRSGLAGLFDQPKYVDGWRVSWRGDDAVLCPDGSLFVSERFGYRYVFRDTSLKEWIDQSISDIGAYRGDSGVTDFERAFTIGSGSEDLARSLRSTLDRVRSEIVRDLGRLLHDRGASI
jgi:hypothetical protein